MVVRIALAWYNALTSGDIWAACSVCAASEAIFTAVRPMLAALRAPCQSVRPEPATAIGPFRLVLCFKGMDLLQVEPSSDRPPSIERPASYKERFFGGSLWIVLVYFLVGILWIIFSDRVVGLLLRDQSVIEQVSMAKGIFYVLVTALLLYGMIRNALMRQVRTSQALEHSLRLQGQSLAQLRENQLLLARSEERYRQLYQTLQCGYGVLQAIRGEDGAVLDMAVENINPAFECLCGVTGEEVGRGGIYDAFGIENAREQWLQVCRQALRTGQPQTYVLHNARMDTELEMAMFPTGPDQISLILNDVTEKRRMADALFEEKERLTVTLDCIGDGVIAADNDGLVTTLNGVAAQITGLEQEQALGMPLDHILRHSDAAQVLRSGEPSRRVDYTVTNRTDGTQRIISENATPIRRKDGRTLGVVLALRDVTERRIREEKILYLSYHDMLTGLYNRTFFEEEIRRLDTTRQMPLSVIMGDVNNLKLVNDVFGHAMGDELLKNVAQILRESCRTEDIIARWGGDEFTILLPHTHAEEALAICGRIQRRCAAFRDGVEGYLSPSISLGYAVKDSADIGTDMAIRTAENTMYHRKLTDATEVYEQFVQSLLRSLYGPGGANAHLNRLTWMCASLGRELGLEERAMENLRTAATLQDIGNVVVDRRILEKPGPLNEEEWEQVRRHPGIGYRIARASALHVAVSSIILNHHERWDGSGYPTGLKGRHIPLEARILAVVDAYDAMTHHRAYRRVLRPEEALREIVAHSGTQFDPDVVNAFLCVVGTADDPMGGIVPTP